MMETLPIYIIYLLFLVNTYLNIPQKRKSTDCSRLYINPSYHTCYIGFCDIKYCNIMRYCNIKYCNIKRNTIYKFALLVSKIFILYQIN